MGWGLVTSGGHVRPQSKSVRNWPASGRGSFAIPREVLTAQSFLLLCKHGALQLHSCDLGFVCGHAPDVGRGNQENWGVGNGECGQHRHERIRNWGRGEGTEQEQASGEEGTQRNVKRNIFSQLRKRGDPSSIT